ncbi:sugar ABC transporter permease [Erysipelothrix larvae]|uniref:Sugar ABC transporter permease n=1 Tax=Erysipelothrix larvae TaxID=1514105 RepID=A0A109UHR3_9FIRM|nr:ABC transporter permease [Erysipelothrix larvae]AMC94622.1 sugar ABC transporter permease [Erysipelothrix larvae]
MNDLYFLIQQMMLFSVPLLVVAIAGMFSERSGVVNIALEGIMIMGAFSGTLFMHLNQTNGGLSGYPLLFASMAIATVTGMVYALFHAFASIEMSADQTISGTALNLFAPAFVIFSARSVIGIQQVNFQNTFLIQSVPLLGDIPIIGRMFFQNAYLSTYLGFLILIIASFVLYKTPFGLRLRSAGENPQATDAAGISVRKIRYAGVLISGALAGLGGLIYIIPVTVTFNADVAGYGFLAIAVLIFGQWKPSRILTSALFFGLLKTISASYSGIQFFFNLNIPQVIYQVIPYVATLIVLVISSKKSQGPKALGEPFDKGKR